MRKKETKCNCRDLIKTGYRESKCKRCGAIWTWSKIIDVSGNYDWEKVKELSPKRKE